MRETTQAPTGKWAILVMAIVACALGAGAVWYHARQGRQVLQLWGPESAQLIRHAAEVELLELVTQNGDSDANASNGEVLQLGTAQVRVVRRRSITKQPGLVHARHALIQDATYEWAPGAGLDGGVPKWEFALRFRDANGQVTLAFDTNRREVRLIERGTSAWMTTILERFRKYVEEARPSTSAPG